MGEIFKRVVPDTPLEWTGERLTTATAGQVEIEHLHRYFLARALCRGRDVLDVASGEGYGTALLAQTALSVIGVEVSPEAVAHAAEAYRHPNLRFLEGDARHLPLDDASVDAVVSFETIEHLYEHDQFLAEVRRVLRPGGRFIISSPERDIYSPSGSSANPYHVRELTTAEFSALLRDSFAHVRLLGQRPMLGSVLLCEGNGARQSLTFEKRGPGHFEAADGLPRAAYLVAVASDQPVADVPDSLYIDTAEIGAVMAAADAADAATAAAEARARAEKAEAEARARAEKAEAELRTKAVEDAEAARAEIAAARAEAVAACSQRDIACMAAHRAAEARAVVEKAEAELRTKAVEDAEAARAEIAAARAEAAAACSQRDIARMAAAEARARAEKAETEMRTKAVEAAETVRAEIAAARAEAAAACSQRDLARMAARRAAASAEGHWRGRMAEAGDRADAARTEATARMLSATQQLQLERTRYESEIAALRREIQAIFDSTIWRASAPLRTAASWLPSALKRAARGGLRAIYWVLTP